jgi:ATP phosphoribosyltransferase regulatory subunit
MILSAKWGDYLDTLSDLLPPDEQAHLKLRALYESYGYRKYRMGKFEPYDIYSENKSFLKGEGIITFTDTAGRLMALRPDVTLSIVKNAALDGSPDKLYYNENIFRIERRGEEYREISQMGVEYIGAQPGYGEAEVVALAAKSLAAVSGGFSLCVSHMGYIGGLLGALGDAGQSERLLSALTHKDARELSAFADSRDLSGEARTALTEISKLRGPLSGALPKARSLSLNDDMANAADELAVLCDTLGAMGVADGVTLDFSVVNALDYYNGVVFRGYVKEAPRAVLAGGRYDNLLRRFNRPQNAVGFAVYLSELERVFYKPRELDTDILLIYGDAAPEKAAGEAERLRREGFGVRAEKTLPPGIKAREIIYMEGAGEYA